MSCRNQVSVGLTIHVSENSSLDSDSGELLAFPTPKVTLIHPDEVFDGDIAKLEIGLAAAVHQAEGDGLTVMRDLDDLVGGRRIFALDQIPMLRRAGREIELRQSRLCVLAFGGHVSRLAACRLIAVSATT
jgi:hypothetical protein